MMMRRSGRCSWVLGLALLLAGGTGAAVAQGKDDTRVTVTFQTYDDVTLVGTFFKGPKALESPTAILIHNFGSDRSKMEGLAAELQSKLGFAVLTFDLRGHGQSKVVKDRFWDFAFNKGGIRGGYRAKVKSEIDFKDFDRDYWPILFNDVMAARYFLDQENNGQRCNTSTVVVIGAGEGAGLGMGWVTEEWDRRIYEGTAGVLGLPKINRIAGEDLAAGVWLGPVTAGRMRFRPSDWFSHSGGASKLREGTPMYFIYGKQDTTSASAVPAMFNAVKRPPDGRTSKPHGLDKEEGLSTKLPGQDLLANAPLQVTEKIVKYLEEVMKRRGSVAWKQQDMRLLERFPLGKYGYRVPN